MVGMVVGGGENEEGVEEEDGETREECKWKWKWGGVGLGEGWGWRCEVGS